VSLVWPSRSTLRQTEEMPLLAEMASLSATAPGIRLMTAGARSH
jgi:hypothetical protein